MSCKATIEQGAKKGTICTRSAQENSYCGKHQAHAQISQGKDHGLKKCKRYRCNTMVTSNETYCQSCIEKKEEENKNKNFCKAKIDQGVRKGNQCDREAGESGYCGKHESRHILLDSVKTTGGRLCEDAKRGCHNLVKEGCSKCEECLEKDRAYEKTLYHIRKEAGNLCVICGIEVQQKIKHAVHNNYLNKCDTCVQKMREIESKRDRNERNYKEEYLKNNMKYYKLYLRGAIKRNLGVYITHEEFGKLIRQPCFYCNTFNEKEVVGIDRIDSQKEYYLCNIVPCCEKCNTKKGVKDIYDFMTEYNETDMSKLYTIQTRMKEIETLPQKVTIPQIIESWGHMKQQYIQSWKSRGYSEQFLEAVNCETLTKEKLDEEFYNEGIRCI